MKILLWFWCCFLFFATITISYICTCIFHLFQISGVWENSELLRSNLAYGWTSLSRRGWIFQLCRNTPGLGLGTLHHLNTQSFYPDQRFCKHFSFRQSEAVIESLPSILIGPGGIFVPFFHFKIWRSFQNRSYFADSLKTRKHITKLKVNVKFRIDLVLKIYSVD